MKLTQDWQVADQVLKKSGLDVRWPTISYLADDSSAITSLNSAVGQLPTTLNCGELIYSGVNLGELKSLGFQNYSVFDRGLFDAGEQLSDKAAEFVLGKGNKPSAYTGDGTVAATSQHLQDMNAFQSQKTHSKTITGTVFHTGETTQTVDLKAALGKLVDWWN